ncbi:EthD domain-containing protein [Bradyrhizobium sp. USDA 10063]
MFILRRRQEVTHANSSDTATVPSTRYQGSGSIEVGPNHVIGPPGQSPCDGVGELWFNRDEAMTNALNSPEMAAAAETPGTFWT